MEVDLTEETAVPIAKKEPKQVKENTRARRETPEPDALINCLRNEKVSIKFVPNQKGLILDPKHVLYGGLGEVSKRRFVVPMLQSGVFKNILTNAEKDYLEHIMGLPDNALSVYKKIDNYWTNNFVSLGKETSSLDLSSPDDYIKYKILLANPDYIAPSKEELQNNRKATYQYVIEKEGDSINSSVKNLNITATAYILFGSIKDDIKKLAAIVENASGKIVSKLEKNFVYAQVEATIKDYPERFVEAAEDTYLDTKILIKDAIETGHVRKRGSYYYLTENNAPLCSGKQEPTLQSACEYLNAPKYQEVLFTLQSKVNKA